MAATPAVIDRQNNELWQRNMNAIGIRVEFVTQKWPDLLKMARLGQLQAWRLGNINTTPEGFGFHGLLYGPHAGFSNLARFNLPEYNRLYEQARAMPDSPERTKLMRKMSEIVAGYAPWVLLAFRIENVIVQPWVVGYKYNPTYQFPFPYLDVNTAAPGLAAK
jgi:ABC-type transport system substrate-binding protein